MCRIKLYNNINNRNIIYIITKIQSMESGRIMIGHTGVNVLTKIQFCYSFTAGTQFYLRDFPVVSLRAT